MVDRHDARGPRRRAEERRRADAAHVPHLTFFSPGTSVPDRIASHDPEETVEPARPRMAGVGARADRAARRSCGSTGMPEARRRHGARQDGVAQPGRQRQGPDRRRHGRGRRAARGAQAGRDAGGADQRQHRHRARDGVRGARLPADPHHARRHERGAPAPARALRRRDPPDPGHRGHDAAPSSRPRSSAASTPSYFMPHAVREPRQPRGAPADDGARDPRGHRGAAATPSWPASAPGGTDHRAWARC